MGVKVGNHMSEKVKISLKILDFIEAGRFSGLFICVCLKDLNTLKTENKETGVFEIEQFTSPYCVCSKLESLFFINS